jgi:formate dehydrogenase iron-sulfur subunit
VSGILTPPLQPAELSTPSQAGEFSIIRMLLAQQQETAVERFSRAHEDETAPLQARYYRDLVPLNSPQKGEQYAFEVDLDSCTGCKACVTACHNLNGLDEGEMWRKVGLLSGGSSQFPVIQHVSTACHHCVEPACMEGCPVLAYEKDPITGIVRHLDDQCIGCQYCVLKCPYDVPRYNKQMGIVRKCDMCSSRLAVGEAPACVQACPNEAIRITVVNQDAVSAKAATNLFLPGAPEPGYTKPSTIYTTRKKLPSNLLPADYWSVTPQHSHLPLVFMLVLTQMSAGAFFVERVVASCFLRGAEEAARSIHVTHVVAALVIGLLGMNAAILHLGRPLYAFRAFIGLRTSWLSREIVAFGGFAGLATAYAAAACAPLIGWTIPRWIEPIAGNAAALAGLVGVFCSVKIYSDTRRPFWDILITGPKFFATALVLGLPVALSVGLTATWFSNPGELYAMMIAYGRLLCGWTMAITAAKFAFESLIFAWLFHRQPTPLKRTALLMTWEMRKVTALRFFCGALGGMLLPAVLLIEDRMAPTGYSAAVFAVVAIFSVVGLLAGELLERYLFFTTVVAPKMPGSPAS